MTPPSLAPLAVEALRDTLPMVPVLLVLYTALELLSHQGGSRLLMRGSLPRAFGPVAGAVLGVIPQCGMSVFVTSLFLGGRVTRGTLVATYLATSDEAIPVLLAHGHELATVLALVGFKLLVGLISGLVVDFVAPGRPPDPSTPSSRSWIQAHVETEMHRAPWIRALAHSLRRTLEICAWVFVITLVLGFAIEWVGLARMAAGTGRHPVLALVGAAIFGLIPNCAASIAIAEGYLRGILSAGAAVAGLCAGAGYGPILLFRRGLLRTAATVLATCLAFSIAAGTLVSLVW